MIALQHEIENIRDNSVFTDKKVPNILVRKERGFK